mmetsp:Transcript_25750/g.60372  ORF Transcript_25750/g.60372 Transcript_25750/m.60372 type:complete len:181 (-) Transcript_25750:123-665(-)|eukprot:CAMPEP_0197175678 /NCGR_PEP_ID=MMETSP1423-20130617/1830_1 /TAXON_ID=476441 /ORGANISM="Pseudo-nitzschia heimii, Strain UNC1101" /LENGTH=180 /DNA_ID=CAMNT_0042624891 /DNA_START=9 /DNA_END=551 /DNA_ORIENTATION=+
MPEIDTGAEYVAQEDPFHNPNRKSKLFFGLCDMRTSTVALNVINVIFTVIVAIILTFMYAFDHGPYRLQAISGVVCTAIVVVSASALGLYSAMNWRMDGMTVSSVAFAAILLFRIIHLDILDTILTAIILYPHVVFTMEMKSGIMSPETFDDEEYVTEGGRDFVEMAQQYMSPTNSTISP